MQRAKSRSGQAILGSPVHMMTGRCCSSLRCLSVLKSQLCWTAQLLKGAETHFSPWGGAVPRRGEARQTHWIISHSSPCQENDISLHNSRCVYLLNGSHLFRADSGNFPFISKHGRYGYIFFSTLAINYSSYFFFLSSVNQIKSNQITFTVTSPQHKCLGEWNSYERAPDSAKNNNLHMDSTYLQTVQKTMCKIHIHILSTHSVL